MTPARQSAPAAMSALRVRIVVADAASRAHWQAAVSAAGHETVEATSMAEVLLVVDRDGDYCEGATLTFSAADADLGSVLPATATPEQIDAAIRAAAAGLIVRSPSSWPGFGAIEDPLTRDALLTSRELEILECVGEGLTNKLIARRLDISLHTVKFHIEAVFRKLGVTTRAQALAVVLDRRRML